MVPLLTSTGVRVDKELCDFRLEVLRGERGDGREELNHVTNEDETRVIQHGTEIRLDVRQFPNAGGTVEVPLGESSMHRSSYTRRHVVVFYVALCFFMLPRNESFFVPLMKQEPTSVPNVDLETVIAVEHGRLEAFLLDP